MDVSLHISLLPYVVAVLCGLAVRLLTMRRK